VEPAMRGLARQYLQAKTAWSVGPIDLPARLPAAQFHIHMDSER